MGMANAKTIGTMRDWAPRAERRLKKVLREARALRGLSKLAPAPAWTSDFSLIGSAAMTRLNGEYRDKAYATDVLSFPAPEAFRSAGHLGELVICFQTLSRQAKEQGHSVAVELDVLLVHGVLHLLGLDHERGASHAREMAAWEKKVMTRLRSRGVGLIART